MHKHRNNVCKKTRLRAESGLVKWKWFLTKFTGSCMDVFMRNLSLVERERRIVMYMGVLYEEELRTEQISRMVSMVRSAFSFSGEDVTAFDGVMVRQARRGGRRSSNEVRSLAEKCQEVEKYPFNLEMVIGGRVLFWQCGLWNAKALDKKAVWLGIALSFDSGLRVSNITAAEKDREDHCIRAGQVIFTVKSSDGSVHNVKGGADFRKMLQGVKDGDMSVQSAVMKYSSNKTSVSCGNSVKDPKYLGRRTPAESNLLNDLIAWMKHSGVNEDDGLLTRYAGALNSRRCLWCRDMNEGVKAIAVSFGLDPAHFSTRSLRSGFSTTAIASGLTEQERNSRGGWAPGSTVPDTNYTFTSRTKGAMALAVGVGGKGVCTEDLLLYAPLHSTTSST
eukprot:gene38494-50550_t